MTAATARTPARPAGRDPGDARLAVRAGGLLARFNAAGVLAAADVHVAERLAFLTGEPDERVALAVALAVRAVRAGSVCLRLDERAGMLLSEVEDDVVDPTEADPTAPTAPTDPGDPGAPTDAHEPGTGAGLQDADLPEPAAWARAIEASPMVAPGTSGPASAQILDRPVRWVDGRLYLDRYWRAEELVRHEVDARSAVPMPDVDPLRVGAAAARLFPDPEQDRQRRAAASAAFSRLTVVTGGPGTGKTTTVARLLAVLQAVAGPGLSVALAAPTGKAAARLQTSVAEQLGTLEAADRVRLGDPQAFTLHRLLGWRPGSSTRFRHDRNHHLPHDVVVVDETSMVSLPMMARLLEALRPQARLVLVGDPDQLASVEAGAVLGDLVARRAPTGGSPALAALLEQALPSDVATGSAADPPSGPGCAAEPGLARGGVVRLVVTHRFGGVIGDLAGAVRAGDERAVLDILRAGNDGVRLAEPTGEVPGEADVHEVRLDAEAAGTALIAAARTGDAAAALRALESHRLLLAHRRGPFGVAYWAQQVEAWVDAADRAHPAGPGPQAGGAGFGPGRRPGAWYPGRPLLVTVNDRDSGLFNGDTGVVIADADGPPGSVVAAFGDPRRPQLVRPHRLPAVETVHAMTVHRAQGSQFSRVSVLLPPERSPLLTRELFYTAVTRATARVLVVGTEQAVRTAVSRPVRRASGLREG